MKMLCGDRYGCMWSSLVGLAATCAEICVRGVESRPERLRCAQAIAHQSPQNLWHRCVSTHLVRSCMIVKLLVEKTVQYRKLCQARRSKACLGLGRARVVSTHQQCKDLCFHTSTSCKSCCVNQLCAPTGAQSAHFVSKRCICFSSFDRIARLRTVLADSVGTLPRLARAAASVRLTIDERSICYLPEQRNVQASLLEQRKPMQIGTSQRRLCSAHNTTHTANEVPIDKLSWEQA